MLYGPTTIHQSNNVKLYPASPSTAKTGQQHTTRNATCYSRYPVNFSNGVWKYTPVVPSANNQIATRPAVAVTAHVCIRCGHTAVRNDGVNWSARNKIDIVNKNTCPDTSCPLRSLGTVLHGASGSTHGAPNNAGWVTGESRTLVKQ